VLVAHSAKGVFPTASEGGHLGAHVLVTVDDLVLALVETFHGFISCAGRLTELSMGVASPTLLPAGRSAFIAS